MGFFDELSKKAGEVYNATKDKASDLSEEIKLKGKISNAESKINANYTEIGKLVYEQLKQGNDVLKEEVMPKVEEISASFEEIERTKAEIAALKETKKENKVEVKNEQPANATEVEAEVKNVENNDNNNNQ